MINNKTYWFKNINVLFDVDKAFDVLPNNKMNEAEKVNAFTRLMIYIGILVSIILSDYRYLYIPIIWMGISYICYLFKEEEVKKEILKKGPTATSEDLDEKTIEKFECLIENTNCALTTEKNPFMNPLPFDNRNRKPACDVLKERNQRDIEHQFDKDLIKDGSDIFNRNNGQRQFYTMPSTTYPNNQLSFMNWLYKTPPTCKEGNGAQCVANLYYPLQRRLFAPGHGSTTNS
tara:strand:+ start:25167 stop:25862 length:696 start_codon:yes stop_codon:yes gene_type:complete